MGSILDGPQRLGPSLNVAADPCNGAVPGDIADQAITRLPAIVRSRPRSKVKSRPADADDIHRVYKRLVFRRFDGFVAKYLGDGVLVYFGYPQAYGDDAERAVRTALELIAAVTGLKMGTSLQRGIRIAAAALVEGKDW
jgi:hypothetical protein